MEAELATRLLKYLDALESGLKSGGDFVKDQAPLVCQEWLNWNFTENLILSILGVASIVTILLVVRCVWSLTKGKNTDEAVIGMTLTVLLGAASLIGISSWTATCALGAVKVYVAPRVVLLEKIQEMTKK